MRWATTAAFVALAACGGKAVVDGSPESGGGGSSPAAGSGGTSSMVSTVALGSSVASSASSGGGGAVNGCTFESAENLVGRMVVDLTWANPFQRCVRVSAGAEVTWHGDFMLHPLAGGVSPTVDASNPISSAGAAGNTVIVVFSPGTYPFFCQVHSATMLGVVYAE